MTTDPRQRLDHDELDHLLRLVQDGVVSRRQLRGLGARPHDLDRMLRRRDLTRVHPGVFVNHTGPLSGEQREWAAVLAHWPAALARESALPGAQHARGPIHVAVALRRTLRPVPGVVAHRTAALDERADWGKAPPRVRLEHAVIDVASLRRQDPAAVLTLLADAVQTRRTSAAAIAATLRTRRVAGQDLMLALLDDLESGACSVLEQGYLRHVERAHRLPTGRRQAPARVGGRLSLRDVDYEEFGLVVELDGRPFHDTAAGRDRDAWRDLEARVGDGATTVRMTYGQVFGQPCRTTAGVTALLARGGWTGRPERCPRCPAEPC